MLLRRLKSRVKTKLVSALSAAAAICVMFAVTPGSAAAQAEQKSGLPAVNTMFSDQAFGDWLAALRKEARGQGISKTTLDAALRDIKPIKRVIELDRRQPEFVQTFAEYLRQRVNDRRVRRGRVLLKKHRSLLTKIYAKYGVPPRYIIAFWGLETGYGDHKGSFRVVQSLATLAYDTRRADFFRRQLLDALHILEQGHISPDAMTGSWAGAMGHMQFLPSTFLAYAVDYTGNGRKNIWGSVPDAFASAANFLSSVGWQRGETWGRKVRLPEGFDPGIAGLDNKKTLKQWAKLGVRRASGAPLPGADMKGSIVLPEGDGGPAFLVYENFRVIMRWNRSISYAISVGHLADRITDR